ncbi:ervatamin-C [Eurytemora carolleeae]|uniref:ervatamin-C n=1 Tax=Eurytemora carolleeae TaxID=1294199 RepID=UPI000C769AC2|nr:ervatamin-C [Eurytemora carolleeae]|eukprot:XP_023340740.1 ervatamin-C-like [Eurytemora affinis]
MKIAIILLAAVSVCVCKTAPRAVQEEFLRFKEKYGKVYQTKAIEEERFEIFKANFYKSLRQNKMISSYTTGITQFSDLTEQEFKDTYLRYKKMPGTVGNSSPRISKDLPDYINWVEKGAVTEVKNQGQCGSCWAFATTEQVESYAFISSGELPNLSAQQVTSCTPNVLQCGGSGGCFGSVTQLGFNYLQLFGQMAEDDYPYVSGTSAQTEECSYDSSKTIVSLTGYDTLPANNHEAVMTHLAEVGPLSIAVDASQWASYTGGVFSGCSFQENISINHGVQLVGYGSDFSAMGVYDYWLVRNSWGSSWGEDGYIKLLRTPECGVNSTPMDGTACVNGPGNDEQTVCGMCGMLLDCSYPLGVQKL